MTAYVNGVLGAAVQADFDPFAGLTAGLFAQTRSALADAIASGAYAAAAEEIDGIENRWETG